MKYISFAMASHGLSTCGLVFLLYAFAPLRETWAADNELTAEERANGWVLLFDGHDLTGWRNNNDRPVAATIEDGAINVHNTGGYLLVYERPFGDFVLKCDVKMNGDSKCNSGVFVRTSDLADPVNTALEVQVFGGQESSMHGFGALYDLVGPTHDARRGPGEWDTLEIRCQGSHVSVKVNGEEVATINCDEWNQPGQRLDGTQHKFGNRAIKDFARRGYLGLQDHGHDVWYKNIKLREL